jgi:hypothetical protein
MLHGSLGLRVYIGRDVTWLLLHLLSVIEGQHTRGGP